MKAADKKEVIFNQHIFKREYNKRLLNKIEETIRTGRLIKEKTEFPKKCLARYFGKENKTYFIIIIEDKDFIEVITSWSKKGK